ncbi:TyeA family type III secretion system gatekeeper subunit [Providencia sp. Me31A]|uniref:TyeA family type III secretion system gatekeeper subunit n=1 Tax=Providencia sp. Me31A TaxID=3392637 RepID=UPI003D2E96DB
MSQIDDLNNNYSLRVTDSQPDIPIKPEMLKQPMQVNIQQVRSEGQQEAMEAISLVMGNRARQFVRAKGSADKETSGRSLLKRLTGSTPKVKSVALVKLLTQFSMLGSEKGDPLAELVAEGLSNGACLALLASLLNQPHLERNRRKRLEKSLLELLEDEWASIDMFTWLDLGDVDSNQLIPLKNIYHRIRQNDSQKEQSLNDWFVQVQQWPERTQRLKVLIRALALDLRKENANQIARIATAINELKRLLLFFSLEDLCAAVASTVGLTADDVLAEIFHLIEQPWIYPDWIESRMEFMQLDDNQQRVWIKQIQVLLKNIPDPCFQDDDQYHQIMEAFVQYKALKSEE